MFSQYVEDITHNYTEGDNWKVVPTGFVALNIDYSKIDKKLVLNNYKETLNTGIPKYFQNYFENACAYGRGKTNWDGLEEDGWNPSISRNLFWNMMFEGKFISEKQYGSESSTVSYIPEVVYFGDIDMHSYNEHKGMGYSEIYCYIPSDAKRKHCRVVLDSDKNYDASNTSENLEGYPNIPIEDYPRSYSFERNYRMSFDDENINNLLDGAENKYDINTIVVLYSIFKKSVNIDNSIDIYTNKTTEWESIYDNLPMGIYFMGNFNDDEKLSNISTKYVTTSYNTGTSYGLRICNRFSATSNGALFNTDVVVDDYSYTNLCQLMTAMNENLSLMLDITKNTAKLTEQYKELESRLINQRMNVPYVKNINGVDYWFVNGKLLASVAQGTDSGCSPLSAEIVQRRIDNLMDDDPTNDYTPISDPNDTCIEIDPKDLANELGMYKTMDDMNL